MWVVYEDLLGDPIFYLGTFKHPALLTGGFSHDMSRTKGWTQSYMSQVDNWSHDSSQQILLTKASRTSHVTGGCERACGAVGYRLHSNREQFSFFPWGCAPLSNLQPLESVVRRAEVSAIVQLCFWQFLSCTCSKELLISNTTHLPCSLCFKSDILPLWQWMTHTEFSDLKERSWWCKWRISEHT